MHSRKRPDQRNPQTCCGEQIEEKVSPLNSKRGRRRHPKPRPEEEVLTEVQIFFEDVGI